MLAVFGKLYENIRQLLWEMCGIFVMFLVICIVTMTENVYINLQVSLESEQCILMRELACMEAVFLLTPIYSTPLSTITANNCKLLLLPAITFWPFKSQEIMADKCFIEKG